MVVVRLLLCFLKDKKPGADQGFRVIGSGPLGRWSAANGKVLSKDSTPHTAKFDSYVDSQLDTESWSVELEFPEGTSVDYRFIAQHRNSQGSTSNTWETRGSRKLIFAQPVTLHHLWDVTADDEAENLKKAKQKLEELEFQKMQEERKVLQVEIKKKRDQTKNKTDEEVEKEKKEDVEKLKKEKEEKLKREEEELKKRREEEREKEESRAKKMQAELDKMQKDKESHMTEEEKQREAQIRDREDRRKQRQQELEEEEKKEEEDRKRRTEDRLQKREARKLEREKRRTLEDIKRKEFHETIREKEKELEAKRLALEQEERDKKEKEEKKKEKERKFLDRLATETEVYVQKQLGRSHKEADFPVPVRFGEEEIYVEQEGALPNYTFLKHLFKRQGLLTKEAATRLIKEASELFRKEPNVVELEAPASVFGDTHGQFYDVIHMFDLAGNIENRKYLFLGDYVDRGAFAIEILLWLFAIKLNYPDRLYLLRGNHECRAITEAYNFRQECLHKHDEDIYELLLTSFQCMPIAAIVKAEAIADGQPGSLFCTHAGIGPQIKTLDDIRKIDRFQEIPSYGPLCDLMWSDPLEELRGKTDEEVRATNYAPNLTRGCSYLYGYPALSTFLKDNNLMCLVRSHEVQKFGYQEHKFKGATEKPLAITIFSAPNYCDKYENYGSVMQIGPQEFHFQPSSWNPHPFVLNNFHSAFNFSIPYLLENVARFLLDVMDSLGINDTLEDNKEKLAATVMLKKRSDRVAKLLVAMKKEREIQEQSFKPFVETIDIGDNETVFEKAKMADFDDENAIAKRVVSPRAHKPQ